MTYIKMNSKLLFLRPVHENRCRTSLIFTKFVSSLVRSSAELDDELMHKIEDKQLKPKKHPGTLPNGPYMLPENVKKAIKDLLKEQPAKQLLTEAKEFKKFLISRQAPAERMDVLRKRASIQTEVENSLSIDVKSLSKEELQRYIQSNTDKVNRILKQRVYNWSRLNFTHYLSLLYLVTRSAAEYSALSKVFDEISIRTSFKPKSIFDFGTGLGSVIWAANNIWGKSICEYYCVDSSSNVIDISDAIIKTYNDEKLSRKIFYRQFLPSSNEVSSDIVVSAYSLLELPSSEARLETLRNLCRRTNRFLVLIEFGTQSGFKILNEARNFILSKDCNEGDKNLGFHVFAPCPHDLPCPRASTPNICYFHSSYLSYPQRPETIQREFFSYIVFEKGSREPEDKQWPRIVQQVLTRSRHAICRFCSNSGSLNEVTFTPTKHGKITYRCAKSSKWGDLFPCTITEKVNTPVSDKDDVS